MKPAKRLATWTTHDESLLLLRAEAIRTQSAKLILFKDIRDCLH